MKLEVIAPTQDAEEVVDLGADCDEIIEEMLTDVETQEDETFSNEELEDILAAEMDDVDLDELTEA